MGACEKQNPVYAIIGSNIKRLRKASGLTQDEFAKMAGVCRTRLSQIETGKANATLERLIKIADGVDAPLTELFVGLESCAPYKMTGSINYSMVKLPEIDE